jgi:hypothetical protein
MQKIAYIREKSKWLVNYTSIPKGVKQRKWKRHIQAGISL